MNQSPEKQVSAFSGQENNMGENTNTDKQIILASLNGHPEDFRVLLDRYGSRILALCRRLVGAAHEAEDLTQKTFVDAYTKLHTFDTLRPFWPWLSRIAVNNCKDFFKSSKRKEVPFNIDCSSQEGIHPVKWDNPEKTRLMEERRFIIEQALMKIPMKYRTVLEMKDIQGLDYCEIENVLDLPVTTLKIRTIRARKKLERAVDLVISEMRSRHAKR